MATTQWTDQRTVTEIHRQLQSPRAYSTPTKEVQLRETDISWVYLTDRFAFKQKRPCRQSRIVHLSLATRQTACRSVLTANRRFAPEVYLDLAPVVEEKPGRFKVVRHHEDAREWLVRMKRLPERGSLESLIADSQLTDDQIARLASFLSDLYAAMPPVVMVGERYLDDLRSRIEKNQRVLEEILPSDARAVSSSTKAQLETIDLQEDEFLERVADGRIVDGHGDLCPEHIFLHDRKPKLIGSIEYSKKLREIDVLDELAFLGMECDMLDAHAVGARVFQAYIEQSNDPAPAFLSHFYKCYRATSRAKACCLQWRQCTHKEWSKKAAQRYLRKSAEYAAAIAWV